MDKVVGKIIILREISENKSILFGPFSEEITLQRKVELWNQVLNKAKSLGLVSYDKDYKYMRDIYWQNLKRGALGKRDNANKTGRDRKYSPIDDMVFEILEKSTVPVPPLIQQTTAKQEEQDSLDSIKDDVNHNPNVVYLEAPETSSPTSKKRTKLSKGSKFTSEEKMRKKKLVLQMEYMELQNYKIRLEVLEMEQKLGVKPSKFTKEIARNMSKHKSVDNLILNDDESDDCDSVSN